MEVTRRSDISGKIRTREIPITNEQFASWRSGTPIHIAMPKLSPDDREFLMTGITPEEWDELFGPKE